MNKTLNFGLIGYGKMGKIRHQTLDQIKQCNVQTVFEENGDTKVPDYLTRVKSPEELIKMKEIDVVVICVPNYLIKQYVISALESGKHVFCEKPPGVNLSETVAMKEAMLKSGCKLMFGFNHRHHQSVIKVKEIVDSRQFGEVLWMRGRYGKSVPEKFFSDWRSKKNFAGGGIFLDQGIHMLDLFMHLIGPFQDVKSFVSNLYWKGDVEDNVFALFRNQKGQVASLHSTMTQWRHLFSLEVFMDQGYIVLNGLKTGSNSYGEEVLNIITNRSEPPQAIWTEEDTLTFSTDDSWTRELNIFCEAILENNAIESCGIGDAVSLMRMVEKVYQK